MNTITFSGTDVDDALNLFRRVLVSDMTKQDREVALRLLDHSRSFPIGGVDSVILSYGVQSVPVSRAAYTEIEKYMREGKKIQAIKELRSATGLGLKEAKDFIEESDQLKRFREPRISSGFTPFPAR